MEDVDLEINNFLPQQYKSTQSLFVNHNYLQQQFSDYELIFSKIKNLILNGDYTLGAAVDELEANFSSMLQVKYAIGVGSGTDALFLSLKALGVGEGDEVITTPFTFFATIGAIVTSGATPVFADVMPDYNIDPKQIEEKISQKTKAILPVHWAGKPCQMLEIKNIANKHKLAIVEDACHAVKATYRGQYAGSFGDTGCFSFHPLKNLNVWGDGGIIVTQSEEIAYKLRLLRNHGLKNRDNCLQFAYNSRLDTLQAIVAQHLLQKLDNITDSRIQNSKFLDDALDGIEEITVPQREIDVKQVYHLYSIRCQSRDMLKDFLISNGVDAKIHYPIPMHLQPAATHLGYKAGDFPNAENIAKSTLSLPVHEFITKQDLIRVSELIKDFYANRR